MRPYTIQTREGEAVSPVTSTRTVFDENGVDLDTLLAQQKQNTDNTFKEYAKKTEVTQSSDKKQDKLSTTSELLITPDNIIGLTERGRRAVFDDMYRTAARQYGSIDYTHVEDGVSKPYQLNGLWLTYEEAVAVMDLGTPKDGVDLYSFGYGTKARTNLPMPKRWILYISHLIFLSAHLLEVANYSGSVGTNGFSNCYVLHTIIGTVSGAAGTVAFSNCRALKDVNYRVSSGKAVSFKDSPLLSYESLRWTVDDTKTALAKVATLTVHPDVYAKLTGDTTNAACAALTDAEREQWVALVERAASKNIIFARP